jgi:hypothetical protein
MTNYEDEDTDDEVDEGNESTEGDGGAAPSGNRNFILALGIMGGIFILVLIGLVWFWLTSGQRGGGGQQADINATNQVIMTANAETASAATKAAGLVLTPSVTPTATNTLVPPSPTNTQVLAQASATNTPGTGGAILTVTPNLQTRTATIVALLTQNAAQTQTQAAMVKLTGTATALPKTGFAEDVGLPGLFAMALGLVLVIVLVRRLRLSPTR